jgi:hypothetical protein
MAQTHRSFFEINGSGTLTGALIFWSLVSFHPAILRAQENAASINTPPIQSEISDQATPAQSFIPPVPSVSVHNRLFHLKETWLIAGGPVLHRGDRFSTTYGADLSVTRFLKNDLGLSVGLSYFRSQLESEIRQIPNTRNELPIAYDPAWSGRVGVSYLPLYGKAALQDHLQYFYIGGQVAAEYLSLKKVSPSSDTSSTLGVSVAVISLWRINDRLIVSPEARSLWYPRQFEVETGLRQAYSLTLNIGLQL